MKCVISFIVKNTCYFFLCWLLFFQVNSLYRGSKYIQHQLSVLIKILFFVVVYYTTILFVKSKILNVWISFCFIIVMHVFIIFVRIMANNFCYSTLRNNVTNFKGLRLNFPFIVLIKSKLTAFCILIKRFVYCNSSRYSSMSFLLHLFHTVWACF